MHDAVDHPKHYTSHPSGVEAIEICQHLDFCLGGAVKYLFREGKKGDALEDLKKSAWYLRRAHQNAQLGYTLGRRSVLIVAGLSLVIGNEPEGSVLRDVLQFIPERIFACETPRIADALARVEREIAARS